jgi:hypothetical protein
MNSERVKQLLAAEESEILERKSSLQRDELAKSMVAFANDMYGHGGGHLIIGQAPDKTLVGLGKSDDEVQRSIVDIARNNCRPVVPISVECVEQDGKRIAIVEIPTSPARPHFVGHSWVRMGSTLRTATDAELMLLRSAEKDWKVARLKRYWDDGQRSVIFWQHPGPGVPLTQSPFSEQTRLEEVNENWITLTLAGYPRSIPYAEFNLGYDPKSSLLQIRYHGAR